MSQEYFIKHHEPAQTEPAYAGGHHSRINEPIKDEARWDDNPDPPVYGEPEGSHSWIHGPLEDEARWDDNPPSYTFDYERWWSYDSDPSQDPAATAGAVEASEDDPDTVPEDGQNDGDSDIAETRESTTAYRICHSKDSHAKSHSKREDHIIKPKPKKPKAAIALFAGIGGTPTGIKDANLIRDGDIEVIIEIEINRIQREMSAHAHPQTEDFPGMLHKYHDVRTITEADIDHICNKYEVVYVTAGWPCTELSKLRDVMPDGSQRTSKSQRTGIHGQSRVKPGSARRPPQLDSRFCVVSPAAN